MPRASAALVALSFVLAVAIAAPTTPTAPTAPASTLCPHAHCFDLSCGVQIAAYADEATCIEMDTNPCTDEDVGAIWTPCDTKLNTRSLVYYYKPPATCRGGRALPAPVTGISCSLQCAAGQHFNGELKTCSDCGPGTYSTGGALRFSDWSAGFPPQFSTECRDAEGGVCTPWRVRNGSVVDSGDHSEQQNLLAVLALRVLLVRDGSLSFEFRVDAEPGYDGLSLFVDDLQAMDLTSQQPAFATFTVPLPRGYRVVKWIYSKDYSMSYGRDRAWLRNITVDGVSLADADCAKCPPGTYASAGKATRCTDCPANSFSADAGAAACTACPATQFSPVGAERCTDRKACTVNVDYIETIGACTRQADGTYKRTRKYEFLQPVICRQDMFTLPPPTVEACQPPPCGRGQYRRDSDAACVTCPDGTWSSGQTEVHACAPCGAGHAAIKHLTIADFSAWPEAMKGPDGRPRTGCDGECSTEGWVLAPSHMYSGIGHGQVADVYVEMALELYVSGALAFTYRVDCPELPPSVQFGAPRLTVVLDGHAVQSFPCPAAGTARFPVPAGPHVVRWIFHKRSYLASPQDVASVDSITVEGAPSGGGGECRVCGAGTFAGPNSPACAACPAGQTSPEGAAACGRCPAGTFAEAEGSPECKRCGKGTRSPEGASGCSYECGLREGALEYSLDRLANGTSMYAAADESGSGNRQFLLDLCVRVPAASGNRSCEDALEGTPPMLSCLRDAEGNIVNTGDVFGIGPLPRAALAYLPPAPAASPGAAAPAGPAATPAAAAGEGGDALTGTAAPLGVLVEYTYGEPLASPPEGATGEGRARRTLLHLVCDATAGQGAPRVVAHNASTTTVVWLSAFACPLCTPEDVASSTTACYNGKQITKYFFAAEGQRQRCFGGEELPPPATSACTVPSKFPLAGFLGAAVMALVLVPAGLFTFLKYRKYRQLYSQYEAIGQQNLQGRELAADDEFEA